jgi:hypothetical protein
MVSPKPLSDFVPDVTLIVFPISVASTARWQNMFLTRTASPFRVKEMIDSDVKANPGANPNSPCFPAAF